HYLMAWSYIIGHESIKRLWQAHVASGQVANAYLLIGPEGIGKRRLALELAKTLNCTGSAPRPCDACPACLQIARQAHPDLHVLVPSGASEQIKIETIRQLLGRVALRPFNARIQLVVLDGAEHLTEEAANSLLKVLEEPPAQTRFVLLSAHLAHCLPTIVSRCQLLRCHPLSREQIMEMLVSAKASDRVAAEAIA
ncbi:MAG: DNA polymerase III subunit delta', partial [Planctomycetota bacterium]